MRIRIEFSPQTTQKQAIGVSAMSRLPWAISLLEFSQLKDTDGILSICSDHLANIKKQLFNIYEGPPR